MVALGNFAASVSGWRHGLNGENVVRVRIQPQDVEAAALFIERAIEVLSGSEDEGEENMEPAPDDAAEDGEGEIGGDAIGARTGEEGQIDC